MKKNYTFSSRCDGLKLDVLELYPKLTPKGIVQISHGMAEHKERYLEFMNYLTNLGYITVIHDHRGHGKSIHHKEDQGYFYDESADFIVEDVHDISVYLKKQYPNCPLYLFGHSMGSLVVRKYLKKYDHEIDKLIVCGPPSKNPLAPLAIHLVNLLQKFKGDRHRSVLINDLAFKSFNKKFKEEIPNCWLSKNLNNVYAYNQNENDGFIFTLNGFKNLFTLMKEVFDPSGWQKKNLELPIFFIAGEKDPVILSPKDFNNAQKFLNSIGYTNIQGKLYNDLRHEILNEDQKESVMNDIYEFIKK